MSAINRLHEHSIDAAERVKGGQPEEAITSATLAVAFALVAVGDKQLIAAGTVKTGLSAVAASIDKLASAISSKRMT